MAHKEPIRKCLAHAGEILAFDQFEILGIPGFNASVLYRQEVSLYEVERQNFSFQIATEDCDRYRIKEDLIFSYQAPQTHFRHTFKINQNPLHDLTGWSKINVDLITTEIKQGIV